MNCRQASKLISAHGDGGLEGELQRQLSEHAGQCAACRLELRSAERLGAILASQGPADPPEGLAARIMDRLPAERGVALEESGVDRWISLAWPSALVAVGAAVLVTVVSFSTSGTPELRAADPVGLMAEDQTSADEELMAVLAVSR